MDERSPEDVDETSSSCESSECEEGNYAAIIKFMRSTDNNFQKKVLHIKLQCGTSTNVIQKSVLVENWPE